MIYISNGALPEPDRIRCLAEFGLNSIKYSINAATRETYKRIHGKDDFETVKSNITELCKKRKSWGIGDLSVFLSFVKCEWNKSEVQLLYEAFDQYVDGISIFNCECQGGGNDIDAMIRNGVVLKKDLVSAASRPCDMIFNRIHVTYEGYLNACCVDVNNDTAVADLREMPLKDAWYSDIFINLRRRHLQNMLKGTYCYNCLNLARELVKPLNKTLACKVDY